ncbi:hypothetical protein [Brumimicrobium oceani]|uniref:Beta-lactamase-inhibitor-like PepSY-like domain-containing protein n=1 Tax=Brumimicrobium oceani TaxID=2100725 RepID=A0A2U2XFE9_9FLAO|nr:hypothetical protein [Brumimicrobium oceani]PWH86431.1 hypothetical protein DIT68_04120 [Brumimicrobium oceani]
MKLTKIVLTGVIAAAMMSTSCSSDSSDQAADSEHPAATSEGEHPSSDAEHPSDSEHPAANSGDEHPSSDSEHPNDADHADGFHEASAVVKHEEVKLTLLPPAVNEALKAEEYLDYKTERAFVIEEDGVKTYEIIVKKNDVESKMLFNSEGIRLDR